MKLLFITQKMDKNDDVLGAYHGWVTALAEKYESIIVICLYEGTHSLPQNVKVLSLGKETGVSRVKYISRFFKYIWQERKNYTSVFVHMNVEYILLAWWYWKLSGKKFAIWYNHSYGTWKGKLAFKLADIVFHTSPYAFSAGRKNSVRMPAGINTDLFIRDENITTSKNSVLYVGRISSVKNVDVLVEAVKSLTEQKITATLNIYGSPDKKDTEYFDNLKKVSSPLEQQGIISYKGSVANYKMPPIYNQHEVFVNLTPKGNYDKTVMEAMACEKLSLVSSIAFADMLPQEFLFQEQDSQDLAKKLQMVFDFSDAEKREWGKKMRALVIERQSLTALVEKLAHLMQ